MGIFKRLFRIGQAEAHSTVDKLEDPIKMSEQGVRELKEKLKKSIEALAQIKALAIRTKNEANAYKSQAKNYENKAIELVQRSQNGAIDAAEADRLATNALDKKQQAMNNYAVAMKNYEQYDSQVKKLELSIRTLKNNISKWENEAKMLKARAKVSSATQEVNKQLSGIDTDGTVAMLEKMKEKVETQEALAESYGELALENRSLDEEIDSVLEETNSSGSDALLELKSRLSGQLPEKGTPEQSPEE